LEGGLTVFLKTGRGYYNLRYVILAEEDPDTPGEWHIETVHGQRRRFTGADSLALVRALDDLIGRGGPVAPDGPADVTDRYSVVTPPGDMVGGASP
jgi:hypothetical protein